MKRKTLHLALTAVVMSVFALFGCSSDDETVGTYEVQDREIYVASKPAHFEIGEFDLEGLYIREDSTSEWTPWLYPITGFDREDGYEYWLSVRYIIDYRHPKGKILYDQRAPRYELIEILGKEQKDSEGTFLQYPIKPQV